jgi:dTDP-glucose 4,6-dehydratase
VKILLTGASGFVGSHVLRHLLINTDWKIICPITFRHKGLPERITSAICTNESWNARVNVLHWDLSTPPSPFVRRSLADVDVIMNVASESHVDRSISEPVPFIMNNMSIMLNMLELAREIRPRLFLQMSTDEVYGPAPENYEHREWDVVLPSNPYSASKAAQEAVAISYWRTYGVPLVITNTMNIIGEMQDPEKFIPLVMRRLLRNQAVPVHVSPDGRPGSRFYLHARNLADAWLFLVGDLIERVPAHPDHERPFRVNIVGEREVDNITMVDMIADAMGKDVWGVDKIDFHASRPGHDLRYALDGTKISRLGWHPPVALDTSLKRTVQWTLDHPEWLTV